MLRYLDIYNRCFPPAIIPRYPPAYPPKNPAYKSINSSSIQIKIKH